jgi:hypothetical protein
MNGCPSRYGGVAAVLVLGIGLLALGKTWLGVGVLVAGILAMAITLSPGASGKALFVAIGALILGVVLGYKAASNEATGTAVYHYPRGVRTDPSEEVTRAGSPAKFREATNLLWTGSVLAMTGAAVAFCFYRKLDDVEADL